MNKIFKKGYASSLYAALTQGLHNSLLGLVYTFGSIILLDATQTVVLATSISTIVEVLMLIFASFLYMSNKFMKRHESLTLIEFLKTKQGRWTLISGFIGGAIGSTAVTIGISYAGAAYGSVLSSLFPAISMMIIFISTKERLNIYGLLALLVVIISAILVTILGNQFEGSSTDFIIGILFGLLAGVSWALEASIVSIVFRNSKIKTSDELLIITREIGSSVSISVIVLPVVSMIFASGDISLGYNMIGEITKDGEVIGIMVAVGLNLHLSWWAYYNAIKHMGATKGTAVNITYVIWGPIFSIIFREVNPDGYAAPAWSYWVFSITMLIGVMLIMYEKKIALYMKKKMRT